jgi:hypothetical protein
MLQAIVAIFFKQGICDPKKKIQIIFAKWRKFDTKKSLTSVTLQNWKKKTASFLEASYRRCPFDTVAQLGPHEASCGRCPFDAVINLVDRKRCPFAAVVNLVVTKHLAQQSYHAKERERGRETRGAGARRELRHAEKEGGNRSRNFYPTKSSSFRASSAWLLWP